jgi:hypothetical protein
MATSFGIDLRNGLGMDMVVKNYWLPAKLFRPFPTSRLLRAPNRALSNPGRAPARGLLLDWSLGFAVLSGQA